MKEQIGKEAVILTKEQYQELLAKAEKIELDKYYIKAVLNDIIDDLRKEVYESTTFSLQCIKQIYDEEHKIKSMIRSQKALFEFLVDAVGNMEKIVEHRVIHNFKNQSFEKKVKILFSK